MEDTVKNQELEELQTYQRDKLWRKQLVIFILVNIALIIGILAYFAFVNLIQYLPVGSTCQISQLFHIYCPGCGGTRAVKYLLTFHWIKSIGYNPFVFYCFILFAYYYVATIVTLVKRDGKDYFQVHEWMAYGALIIIIGFFILRNVLLICFHYDYIGDLIVYWS